MIPTHPKLQKEEAEMSSIGFGCCTLIAAMLFPLLIILGWVTMSPIYRGKDAVELFVSLRNGSSRLLSGRLFRSMILHHTQADELSKR
jgi:hypothetical protein